MDLRQYLKENIVYLDGGMGTLLQSSGLKAGELPERWNVTHSNVVTAIYKSYYDAGANIVNTNTFGANALKFSESELDEIVKYAIENAKKAREQSKTNQPKWIALDIGPSGKMLAPYGTLDFEEAVEIFAKTVRLGVKYGADLVFIETMTDSYETKAALLAVKENCDLPVFVSNAFGSDGKLMTGATAEAMVAMLEGMGADAIGVNCSLGPKQLAPIVKEYLKYASVPVLLEPNAGLPRVENGKTVYDVSEEEFASEVALLVEEGVRLCGGCCGTTPKHISLLKEKTQHVSPKTVQKKNFTTVSSYTHAVTFGQNPILIGERINPTGKKKFKEALKNNDMDYILKEGIAQEEKGVHILDVNVGLPEIDEEKMLVSAVKELQAVTALPLQIDTSNARAMESAVRVYNGKPMLNSVNGKKESMQAVFPLAKKYGGVVVALTLDEGGIPTKAEDRLKIARRILKQAQKYGIDKKDIVFDPLALTISADNSSAIETLKAVKLIREKLGCHVTLGVSNVSFGLPNRDIINSAFFALALNNGLSGAIMNPYSTEMLKTYYAFNALSAMDDNCASYVNFATSLPAENLVTTTQTAQSTTENYKSELQKAIVKGLKDQAGALTKELLTTAHPLDIIKNEIIPALDTVGVGFEKKTVYLPQLLMSAESAKCAFDEIKKCMKGAKTEEKCAFVIATVKGDIHDIGKNIVKLLLENYGFAVTDLGRDVDAETIVETAIKLHAPLVGLSALMTTTVPAMEEAIKLLKEKAPWVKTVVGGAVLTQEYADKIGADKYAKDAMETVRYAEEINALLK
ncbi:MAG: homocysteine S-methyltransferase family protein [Clostridia bacterium]|nr:homocysteine S-methyltransferase family protein [Clostridia bacterium]